jgi:hypothetical protein
MNPHKKLAWSLTATIAMLAAAWGSVRPVEATPASGVTFTVLSRATVPEFEARRRYLKESKDTERHRWKGRNRSKTWKIELEATRMIDVVTVLFTVQPGGNGGWHTHPGPALFTIRTGTLTMYDGNDPACEPQLFPAGTGSVEAEDSEHIHTLRNETGSVVETIVTFLVPVGAMLRTDLPDPGNCSF